MTTTSRSPLTIAGARSNLGKNSKKYTDDELNLLLVQLTEISTVLITQIRFQNKLSHDITNVDYRSLI
jgi:hypothetical protein